MMTPAEPTRAQIERAKSRSVFIATPIARRPTYQYTLSLATTVGYLTRLGIRWAAHAPVGNSDLAKARNELAAMFLASEAVTGLAATDMIFIDDDIGWSAGDIVRLLASDRYVIGGVGAKRRALHDTDINKWCYRPLPGLLNQRKGAIEVETVGTGFLKITREPFLRMIEAHPEWKRPGLPNMPEAAAKYYHRFFSFYSDTFAEEWGEDAAWCRDYRALGGTVWIDPTIRLMHVGEAEYTGNIEAMFPGWVKA